MIVKILQAFSSVENLFLARYLNIIVLLYILQLAKSVKSCKIAFTFTFKEATLIYWQQTPLQLLDRQMFSNVITSRGQRRLLGVLQGWAKQLMEITCRVDNEIKIT